jgi:uncharacterized Ntn-hydrolase superfamily protein
MKRNIRQYLATAIFMLAAYSPVLATWSIIVIDPKTKEIGMAGASCSYNCYGIGSIVPGQGAVMVQAMSNNQARAKGIAMLKGGATPDQIISEMRKPEFDPERQQYAVVRMDDKGLPATYTGQETNTFNGALAAEGISVQGNTLTNENEIKLIFDAVMKARQESRSVQEILMIALEAGSVAGGDKRCGNQKATSAFITVAKPTDNARNPYLNLVVYGQDKGGENAVTLLREKYEKWKNR